MSWFTNIVSSWKLGQEIPKVVIYGALGALALAFFVCGKTPQKERTVYLNRIDTLTRTIRTKVTNTQTVYVTEVRTVVRDSNYDCWDTDVTLAGGNVAVRIDSVNSCKGIYRGIEFRSLPDPELLALIDSLGATIDTLLNTPMPDHIPDIGNMVFGFRGDVFLGASLPHGAVIGANARVWFGKIGLFFEPRVCLGDWKASSVDGGLTYRVF